MLETVTPINFRSFGPDTKPVTLGKLNILIGANGSGKTNFLRWCQGDRDGDKSRPFYYLCRKDGKHKERTDFVPALRRVLADDAMRERLYYYLNDYSCGISEISVDAPDWVFITENNIRLPFSQCPESLRKILTFLIVLFDPVRPKLVLIDDLCGGFHLDLHSTLAGMIEEASEWTQIVATTYSETVLDAFTNKPEYFYVTEKDQHGHTQVTQLNPKELEPWLAKYSLGNLWVRGDIGGKRW